LAFPVWVDAGTSVQCQCILLERPRQDGLAKQNMRTTQSGSRPHSTWLSCLPNSTYCSRIFLTTRFVPNDAFVVLSATDTNPACHRMTRTERALHPREISKASSQSKTGSDERVQKNGTGAHGCRFVDHEMGPAMLDDSNVNSDQETSSTTPATRRPFTPTVTKQSIMSPYQDALLSVCLVSITRRCAPGLSLLVRARLEVILT
jgi:hypothetical protein